MNVLVLNAGSSSQKTCLYHLPDSLAEPLPDEPTAPVWHSETDGTPGASLERAFRTLWEGQNSVLAKPDEIHAVGHRVVHGGEDFRESVRVTPEVKATIQRLAPLAPSHNPAALAGMEAVEKLLGPDIPQFAVFDTAFHRTLSDSAAIYPGPYEWASQMGIRRYGFHGINHGYVAGRAAHLLGRDPKSPEALRLISCHLGNGCSLAAIRGGQSLDTTMGFTPLEGLMMGTRSGSIDPAILLYLQREKGATPDELDRILNRESGLKGISGLSGDMREIAKAVAAGNSRAKLAFDMFVHRLRSEIGAMLASLGGVDALIFTGGIGEHSAQVRAGACAMFAFLGLKLDDVANNAVFRNSGTDRDIAATDAAVRILVIAAQEDWAIAAECRRLLG